MEGNLKIFITGVTGFIGQHFLVDLLHRVPEGTTIYILVRKDMDFGDDRVVKVKGDLRQIKDHEEIIKTCDYVFHLAANVNFFNGNTDDDAVNFEPTVALVDMLKNSEKLKNFVFASSIGAVDRHESDGFSAPLNMDSKPSPRTIYGESKLKSEEYIKNSGLPYTIIRPTWVYGENMRPNSHINKFVSITCSRIPLYAFKFPGKVSLVHVGDLVAALSACVGNNNIIGKTYFATTEAKSIGDLFKHIHLEVRGKEPKQFGLPKFLQKLTAKFHHKIPLTTANLFVDYLYADGGAFVRDFSVNSPTYFSQGLKDVVKTNNSLFNQVRKYQSIGFGFLGTWLKHSLYPIDFFKKVLPIHGLVLDFGCGEGMLANLISQSIPGIKLIGFDKDEKRVEQANQVASANAQFVHQKIEDVDVIGVKAIIINDVLHHHEKEGQKEIIQKALDSLEEDGLLIIKEVDAEDRLDKFWSNFWDTKLYPEDTLTFRPLTEWKQLLSSMSLDFVDSHRVKHFWPASRNILVYRKR